MDAKRPLLAAIVVVVAGCGDGGGGHSNRHAVQFDVGGFVAYEGERTVGLPGVAVTLVDSFASSDTATTGSNGLWTITDVDPGVYVERYELAGYEPVTGAFALEAFGENDVSNPFIARSDVLLEELRLAAIVTPFNVEVQDTSELIDGVGNHAIAYDISSDGPIVVEFPQALASGFVILEDEVTNEFESAILDSVSMAQFVLSEATIDAMNTGAGLTADNDPLTRHRLSMFVSAYSPIHGKPLTLEASLEFNAVP